MFFHAYGVDVIQDGTDVKGVVFESKQGRQAILAKQVVDCSGDADVLFQAGGDYKQITHGIGHVVRLANMDRIWAKQPPKGPDGKVKGTHLTKWPMRSNEANPCTWWGNFGTGPKGNGPGHSGYFSAACCVQVASGTKRCQACRQPWLSLQPYSDELVGCVYK